MRIMIKFLGLIVGLGGLAARLPAQDSGPVSTAADAELDIASVDAVTAQDEAPPPALIAAAAAQRAAISEAQQQIWLVDRIDELNGALSVVGQRLQDLSAQVAQQQAELQSYADAALQPKTAAAPPPPTGAAPEQPAPPAEQPAE